LRNFEKKNYQEKIQPIEGVNNKDTENYIMRFVIGTVHNVNVIG